MKPKAFSLAYGGLVAALCWVLLVSAGLLPFMSYTMPSVAGFALIAVALESGVRRAWLTYAAVSLLGLITATDMEAVVLFILLFGYYPTLRLKFEVMRPWGWVCLLKMALFNTAILTYAWVMAQLFGLGPLLDNFGEAGRAGLLGLWLAANVVFWIYDRAVGMVTLVYIRALRPKLGGARQF